jgi:uncharacterized protein YndB with AHSA1/START domain
MNPDHAAASPSRAEIIITRVFDAPLELVWKAWTDPQHVAQWWGPRGFTTTVTELDLRPGGRWRYCMRGPEGTEHPVKGVFEEVVPKARIVTSNKFDDDFKHPTVTDLPSGLVTMYLFEDLGHQTRLTLRLLHPSVDDRRKHESMGVVAGWNSSLDCLAEHLVKLAAEPAVVRVSRRFEAPAELVFDSWLEPARIGTWMFGANVRDEEVLHLEVDPRIGGSFSFLVRRQGTEFDHVGTYREIDRPRRLVFTWGIAGESAGESVVTIDIRPTASGCELQLTHLMDPKWAGYASRVESGWTTMLNKLAGAASGSYGRSG